MEQRARNTVAPGHEEQILNGMSEKILLNSPVGYYGSMP
jgi:hypothetical protein